MRIGNDEKNFGKLVILFLIAILFHSCHNERYNNIVVGFLDELKPQIMNDSLIFDLKDVHKFDWDYLYIIDGDIYPDEISQILGMNCKCNYVSSVFNMVFFIHDNKIVKYYKSNYYRFRFVSLRNSGVIKIDAQNSKFYIKMDKIGNEPLYKLFPLGQWFINYKYKIATAISLLAIYSDLQNYQIFSSP